MDSISTAHKVQQVPRICILYQPTGVTIGAEKQYTQHSAEYRDLADNNSLVCSLLGPTKTSTTRACTPHSAGMHMVATSLYSTVQ